MLCVFEVSSLLFCLLFSRNKSCFDAENSQVFSDVGACVVGIIKKCISLRGASDGAGHQDVDLSGITEFPSSFHAGELMQFFDQSVSVKSRVSWEWERLRC